MKITYWSDFACPYCYIGNTRLKKTIKDLGLENEVEFDTRAFELDQNAPKDVESTTVERFAVKYGLSLNDAEKEVSNISRLGIEEGIDFKYSSTLYTNTRDAHRLMKFAQSKGDAKLVEKLGNSLFDAYFTKNLKLADKEIALMGGIHAVPFYLLDEKYSIPGALSYEDFKTVLKQISDENKENAIKENEKKKDGNKDVDSCKDGVCRI